MRRYGLSANTLKIIAAVTMFIDHIGVMLLPNVEILRIIGRIAFPIFSFMICEGCRYTKNKIRYFLRIFLLGLVTSAVYYLSGRGVYLSAPVTFSCSIVLIYIIQLMIRCKDTLKKWCYMLLVAVTAVFYTIAENVTIDYGFWGIMLPVFAAAVATVKGEEKGILARQTRFLGFAVGLVILAVSYGGNQPYALVALLPLALYNGEIGVRLPKYAFYVFYPAHMAVLWVISLFWLK